MTTKPLRPIAVVTGAASGIGAATAKAIAGTCHGLVLHTRGASPASRERLAAVGEAARSAGAQTLEITSDLADAGSARALIEACTEHFGRLDHVVSNAGFADRRGTADLQRRDLERALDTMAVAFLELAQAATPHLARSMNGRIVYVSSFVVRRFARTGLFPVTAAAKAAGEALMRTLAMELAPSGVTVNAVAPGFTRKDGGHSALGAAAWDAAATATPLGRIAEPSDIAGLIAFLLSPQARHITGQTIAVDGGLSLGCPQ